MANVRGAFHLEPYIKYISVTKKIEIMIFFYDQNERRVFDSMRLTFAWCTPQQGVLAVASLPG